MPVLDPSDPAGGAPTVAVIGAGAAGLLCARLLAGAGARVTIFDKGRGPGGRMSTRRTDGFQFDHGAQYFTARDPRLAPLIERLRAAGAIAPWRSRVADGAAGTRDGWGDLERWVGLPAMNQPLRVLAEGLDLRCGREVATVRSDADGWRLGDAAGNDFGRHAAVAVAVPAPQAAALLVGRPDLARLAGAAEMAPCWAGLVATEGAVDPGWDVWAGDGAVGAPSGPLGWVARDGSKPGRGDRHSWVLHADPAWSRANLELSPERALPALLEAFASLIGGQPDLAHASAHRWRYARVLRSVPTETGCLWDPDARIGACGDWCVGPRVEAALLSGLALAEAVTRTLDLPRPSLDRLSLTP